MKLMRNISTPKLAISLLLSTAAALAQYKSESAGAPPSEVAPPIAQALQKDGIKVTNNGKPYCEGECRQKRLRRRARFLHNTNVRTRSRGTRSGKK